MMSYNHGNGHALKSAYRCTELCGTTVQQVASMLPASRPSQSFTLKVKTFS